MKKVIRMQNLGCANCAAKMETKISALAGVNHASISFMTQRLVLECEDSRFEGIVKEAQQIIRKIEPDCKLMV